jgi:membrane protease YdiL (CAAX protease family)
MTMTDPDRPVSAGLRSARGSDGSRDHSPTGRQLLAVIGVWLLLSALGGVATVFAARFIAPSWGHAGNVTVIVVAEVYAAFLVAAAFVLRRKARAGVALHRAPGRTFVLAVGVLGIAYAATALAHTFLAPFIGAWSDTVAILRAVGSDDGRLANAGLGVAAIIVLRACVLAPIVEELLFRGALFAWLRQRLSASLTIAVTSIAFAAIHAYPAILPLTFAIGVAFGWIRERSGSVAPTIVVHVVHNVLLVAFAYATVGWGARLPPWPGE